MFYTLFNNSNKAYLTHPQVGLWFTENKEEAESMLKSCHDYLKSMRMEVDDISIAEIDETYSCVS